MKRFTLLLLSFLTASYTLADRIDSETARQNVAAFLNQGSTSQRRAAAKVSNYQMVHESKAYYVFANATGNGYIIAAADDNMASPVLGFSDTGTFDVNNMPENMKWWLSQYDNEADILAANPTAFTVRKAADRTNIEPLLETMWDQKPYFNKFCPVVGNDTCYTGCVATAISQIMYYYKWPEYGQGYKEYKWSKDSILLSTDFSQSKYNWDAMLLKYNEESSDEAIDAVAKLMHDAGIALEMQYRADGSTAQADSVPNAISQHFRYSREACFLARENYTDEEWEQLVYESLKRSEPICYGGNGAGGHTFICDGYKDGFYHFNWGWSGKHNDYFLLSALKPYSQSYDNSTNGFNGSQHMTINIRPDKDGSSKPIAYMTVTNDFDIVPQGDGKYTLFGAFSNATKQTIRVNTGLEFVDSEGVSTFYYGNKKSFDIEEGNHGDSITIDTSYFPTANGKYTVYPAYYDAYHNTDNRMHGKIYNKCFVYVTIQDGVITITEPDAYDAILSCTDLTYGKFYAGKYPVVTATLTNNGTQQYSGDVCLQIKDPNKDYGDDTPYESYANDFIDIQPGKSKEFTAKLQAPDDPTKKYILYALDCRHDTIFIQKDIEINAVPKGDFKATLMEAPTYTFDSDKNVTINAKIQCTEGYQDNFGIHFYLKNSTDTISKCTLITGCPTGKGDIVNVSFTGKIDTLQLNSQYKFRVGFINASKKFIHLNWHNGNDKQYEFDFNPDDISAINAVEQTPYAEDKRLYNLNGQQIVNPVKGQLYIMGGRKVIKR